VAIWQRFNVKQPITQRAPGEKSSLPWLQKEGWSFFQQVRKVLNWAVTYLGKVGVDHNDVPGVAEAKLIAGAGVSITKIGADGSRQLLFSANVPPPVLPPDPSLPPDSPVPGALLYPALKPDSKLRRPCKGLLRHGSGVGFNMAWEPIGGGMWRRTGAGPLNFAPADVAVIPAQDGDRVFAWSGMYTESEFQYYGVYDVLDCGFHMVQAPGAPAGVLMGVSSQAIIRRAADANTPATLCHGMVVQIDGPDGVEHNGDYFTLDTADPIVVDTTGLTFTASSFYLPSDKYLLLTAAMVSQTATVPFEAVATATNAELLFTGDNFGIVLGALGVDKIPAGQVTFYLSAKCDAVPTDGVNTIHVLLFKYVSGSSTTVCEGYTSPIWSTALATYTVVVDIPTDIDVGPTDILYFGPTFKTTSLVAQTCRLETGSPWDTKIQTTFQLGRSSSMHDDLGGRDLVNNHYGVGAATTVSGIIPVPTKKKMVITVSGNPVLQGMHAEGLETGVDIALTFLQSCSIIGEASGLGTGICKFLTSHMDGSTPDNLDTLPAGARIGVTYYATELPQSPCFQLTWGPLS
jgi:hypothetical protein